ncbi:hypothetical protein K2P56_01605 [Patescibacteria group bacterium]|nr:hypothetical protein [Patescibacteria group bacterium]
MNLSQYSPDSQKAFLAFLFFVVIVLLCFIGYQGLYTKSLEEKVIEPQEAQAILDTLPDNPDSDGLTSQDRASLLNELGQ